MRVPDLVRLYDYDSWANARLLAAVARLTPEEFVRPVAGSYGSVRNTLVHVMSAEWGWVERCGGHARGERLTPERYPTPAALIAEWARVEGYARELLAGLTDDDLAREVAFSFGGPTSVATVGALLQHAALHAVHHRGQVALLLRELGHAPGNFDMLYFATEGGRTEGGR
ncbi:DinB family protein [Roseisolibacter agri]|uniref:Diguanylate cyclase n=1 Tax=Roseisolibacter agri TaxID=2014610 RepID=A0AA37QFM7_9BACT|nr:DinB family protein [Roseisolibacter agri]GLC25923.1 diguanylate cyclase [Roseisolibacter agri]